MTPRETRNRLRAGIDALPLPARQFVAYGATGACTTSLDAALFALAVAVLDLRAGIAPTIAATATYVIASAVAYVLNSRVAFRAQHRGDSAGTIVRFAVTFASSAVLAAGVFALAHYLLGNARVELLAAKGVAIATIIVWNFTLLRAWVFRPPPTAAPGVLRPGP